MSLRKLILSTVFSILTLFNPITAEAQFNWADYEPYNLGSYWTYQNVESPFDTYTLSVLKCPGFAENPACYKEVEPDFYLIGYNDGNSVAYYAYEEDGILYDFPDVSIGDFSDGYFIQFSLPDDYMLLRVWDNLDSEMKSVYGIDPSLTNLVLWASYDSNFPANSQNSIVESNLDISLPDYAVTHLVWHSPGVGMIVNTDIDAATGAIEERYDLIDYSILPFANIKANDSDGPIDINTGGNLSVTVELDSGDRTGEDADWWVAEFAPDGWYYYSLSTFWASAGSSYTDLLPTYQGALFDMGSYSVLNSSGLSEGTHTFYFAIDTNMDGNLDLDQIYYDSVEVNVTK